MSASCSQDSGALSMVTPLEESESSVRLMKWVWVLAMRRIAPGPSLRLLRGRPRVTAVHSSSAPLSVSMASRSKSRMRPSWRTNECPAGASRYSRSVRTTEPSDEETT